MLSFNPCLGMPLRKGTTIIASIDLVICVVCATVRLIRFEYHEYHFDEMRSNMSLDANQSNNEILANIDYTTSIILETIDAGDASSQTPLEIDANTKTVGLGFIYKTRFWYIDSYFAAFVAMVIIEIGVFLGDVVLEAWMCKILITASNNRDHSGFVRWLMLRIVLTIIKGVVIFLVRNFEITFLTYDWVDCMLDLLILYRILELFIINEIRRDISAMNRAVKSNC